MFHLKYPSCYTQKNYSLAASRNSYLLTAPLTLNKRLGRYIAGIPFFSTKGEEEQVSGATLPNVLVDRYRRVSRRVNGYARKHAPLFFTMIVVNVAGKWLVVKKKVEKRATG